MEHERIIKEVMKLKSKNNIAILEQFNQAKLKIECDDYGFYVTFNFEKKPINRILDLSSIQDVSAYNKNMDPIADFILFINNGIIEGLEESSYDKWPLNDDNIIIKVDNIIK